MDARTVVKLLLLYAITTHANYVNKTRQMLAGLWGEPENKHYACILYNLTSISAMYSEHKSTCGNNVFYTISLLAFIVVFVHD